MGSLDVCGLHWPRARIGEDPHGTNAPPLQVLIGIPAAEDDVRGGGWARKAACLTVRMFVQLSPRSHLRVGAAPPCHADDAYRLKRAASPGMPQLLVTKA
jgi:hypothetical protein